MYFGFSVAFLAFVLGTIYLLRTIFLGNPVPGYPSLIIVMLFMGGVQLFTIGIIGEYIGRIYTESKRRPLYLIRTHHGFADSNEGQPNLQQKGRSI
jgi:glycosyltransferase involved in cell wall biosynthesis